MIRRFVIMLILSAVIGALFVGQAQAYPDNDPDTVAIRSILAAYQSPIPWWTVAAFKANNPTFDVAGFLAVSTAESSMGKAGKLHNIGSIRGGPVGSLWRDLRVGVTKSGYNIYKDDRSGTRALIRLLWERGYNELLAADNWWGFANRYYGRGVPGIGRYVANLRAAHQIIVKEAATYDASW